MAKKSRLKEVKWCHKSTKGTNEYRECTHAVHMYDLHLNPAVCKFLNLDEKAQDAWRTSELVQWAYRTSIRNDVGGPVNIFFASERMKGAVRQLDNEPTPG